MDRWHEASFQRDLGRFLGRARKGNVNRQPLVTDDHLFRTTPGRAAAYYLQEDDLVLLRSLQRRLAGSSRKELGLSLDEARALLLAACDEAVAGAIKGAIASLIAEVEAPIEDWTVAKPVAILIPGQSLTVGHTTYSTRFPRSVAPRKTIVERATGYGLVPPVAVTKVRARGQRTAQILAAERFAESASILDLIDRPKLNVGEMGFLTRKDGSGNFALNRPGWIIDQVADASGKFVPPYLQLSRAAARAEDKRSDWARRVLAATRWFSRGCRSEWPADRLASFMVALECLFVEGRTESNSKGSHVATRLTDRFQLQEMTKDEQSGWLRNLYQARNDAVHEGREYTADLDVDRLGDLTLVAIRRLALHLIPGHRRPGRSCANFKDAMKCSGR